MKEGQGSETIDKKVNQHGKRGVIQAQAGAPWKKTSGAPYWQGGGGCEGDILQPLGFQN